MQNEIFRPFASVFFVKLAGRRESGKRNPGQVRKDGMQDSGRKMGHCYNPNVDFSSQPSGVSEASEAYDQL